MSDCCSVKGTLVAPGVAACPESGARSKQVDVLTVKSLVRRLPLGMPDTQYYFCEAQDCDVVYWAASGCSSETACGIWKALQLGAQGSHLEARIQ
jgi:hypothetical protein